MSAPDLLLPVGRRLMSSWASHQRRNPKSSEPGTDFYCPIGTEIIAPADGVIYGFGESIAPATGRWVGIAFDHGESFRCMHHKRIVRKSGRVRAGEVIAISGASGYGEEDWSWNPATGGAHTHATLWPTHDRRFGYRADGRPYTIDFMTRIGASAAGGNASPFEEDDMVSEDAVRAMIDATNRNLIDAGQRQHDVTRAFVVDQAQRQHDVTRGLLADLTQAQHDVTRGYVVDTVVGALGKITPTIDDATIKAAVKEAVAGVKIEPINLDELVARVDAAIEPVNIDAISKRVNDEADQRERDRLGGPLEA